MSTSTTNLSEEQQRFYGAMRLRAVSRLGQPFIRAQIFALIPVSSPGLGTTSVDQYSRVYIDFDLMMERGIEVATKYLLHEAWHILRDHFGRAKGLVQSGEHDAWNVAGDCEINDDIPDTPDNFFQAEQIGMERHEQAETYFTMTRLLFKDRPDGGEAGDSGEGEGEQGDGPPSCGPGSGNMSGDGEYLLGPDEAPVRSEERKTVVRRQVADEILRNPSQVGPAGVGSGQSLIEWARIVKAGPETPWEQVLRNKLLTAHAVKSGMTDISWNQRSILADCVPEAVLPGDVTPNIRIAIPIDTSASAIGNASKAVHEVGVIMDQLDVSGDDLMVFSVDWTASEPKRVNSLKDIRLVGGGGTDMSVAIQTVSAMQSWVRPHICIVITDGETPWPDERPDADITYVACIIPNSHHSDSAFSGVPSWMEKVIIRDPR